jgi:hypothetical protein
MPTKKKVARRGAKVLAAITLAAGVLPGVASAETGDACPAQPVTQSFLSFGDLNYYFLAPGGDFEETGVWSVSGEHQYAQRDDDLLELGGPQALVLGDGAQATSPAFCVDDTYPHLRLGAEAGGSNDSLTIEALPADGPPVTLATLDGRDFRSAAPSGYVPLAPNLELELGDMAQVQLRFTASGWWGVDFVSIDPRRAR